MEQGEAIVAALNSESVLRVGLRRVLSVHADSNGVRSIPAGMLEDLERVLNDV